MTIFLMENKKENKSLQVYIDILYFYLLNIIYPVKKL